MTTTGHDRLFRVRFPAAVEGGAPVSESGNAVIGRPFGRPNVDVAEVPFTLDHPAYNWFALGATARIALGDAGRARVRGARGSRDRRGRGRRARRPRQDDAVRGSSIALVRQGVTSTVSRHDGHRYGVLHIDSNLPDVRLAIGGPTTTASSRPCSRRRSRLSAEFDRQLAGGGRARLWVPEGGDRGAGRNRSPTCAARATCRCSSSPASTPTTWPRRWTRSSPISRTASSPSISRRSWRSDRATEDYTVAVINRGMPGFNVETDGNLYLSIMRSCSGWPSGVWIDPPRRSTPDGANFQFQHWSHAFDYAIAAAPGDWRRRIVRAGHDFNNPLVARVFEPPGPCPRRRASSRSSRRPWS